MPVVVRDKLPDGHPWKDGVSITYRVRPGLNSAAPVGKIVDSPDNDNGLPVEESEKLPDESGA
jgi:hypothetical protein